VDFDPAQPTATTEDTAEMALATVLRAGREKSAQCEHVLPIAMVMGFA